MKTIVKIFCSILFVTICFFSLKAQWTLTPPYLYTTTNQVGIGTSTPSSLLHINGGDIKVVSGNIDVNTGTGKYMINALPVLWNNSIASNIYVGQGAGNATATGAANTFLGTTAGASNTSGASNTYLGNGAAVSNQSGSENVAVGVLALGNMVSATENVGIGTFAGYNTTASYNTFIGSSSGYSNTTGIENVFVGQQAGYANSIAGYNTFVGQKAGYSNTLGERNVFLGSKAGYYTTTGFENLFVGSQSGYANTTGAHNICIGEFSNLGAANLTYAAAIGAYSIVTQSNSLILGCISGLNSAPVSMDIGIGVTAPARRLEIMDAANPQLRLTNSQSSSIRTDFQTTSSGHLLIAPSSSGTAKNVGINFTTSTSPVPSQTLDVNGTAAIRSVANDNALTRILVVDNANNGVIKYRDVSTISGNVSSCATSTENYLTKWCSTTNNIQNSIVYDNGSQIGIGVNAFMPAKLNVLNSTYPYAISGATIVSSSAQNTGVYGSAFNSTFSDRGIHGQGGALTPGFPTMVGNNHIGVIGWADGGNFNIGGVFEAGPYCSDALNYGIFARGARTRNPLSPNCNPGIAGVFDGYVTATNIAYPSDQMLKDSIIDIKNALGLIAKIKPREYIFKVDSFTAVSLPYGKHYGIISEEIDTVLPDIIVPVTYPEQRDSTGAFLNDSVSFNGVTYMELIPIAVAGIKEQQAIIDTLKNGQVGTVYTATDSNYVVKWSGTNKKLENGLMYDDGQRVGIPSVNSGVYVNVLNHNQLNAASFESDSNTAEGVIKATYQANGNTNSVPALYGYSKYVNAGSEDDGMGAYLEGGSVGAYGLGTGANSLGFGLFGESMNATYINSGVRGVARTYAPVLNAGMFGSADSADFLNIGAWGEAQYINTSADNVGVAGMGSGSDYQNFGGRFDAFDSAGVNYGIYASVAGSAPDFYAGYFNGDVHATGVVTWTSDARLKSDIADLKAEDALSSVLRLAPKTYTFNRADYPYLSLPAGNQYGLIAQDVEQVLPNLVSNIIQPEIKDTKGTVRSPRLEYKGLNYAGIIPLLVGAVKQQQTTIDSLTNVIDTRLAAMEERLNSCCGAGNAGKRDAGTDETQGSINHLNVELGAMQVVVLEQNVPNPFAEQTSISYFIPDDVSNAQVIFADMLGRVIKTIDVDKGYGVMTVFASSLSAGQYTYSLLINGKVIETKKMMKSK